MKKTIISFATLCGFIFLSSCGHDAVDITINDQAVRDSAIHNLDANALIDLLTERLAANSSACGGMRLAAKSDLDGGRTRLQKLEGFSIDLTKHRGVVCYQDIFKMLRENVTQPTPNNAIAFYPVLNSTKTSSGKDSLYDGLVMRGAFLSADGTELNYSPSSMYYYSTWCPEVCPLEGVITAIEAPATGEHN